jgi:peptidoglycan/LPS O-acetylase OafA/YrhL
MTGGTSPSPQKQAREEPPSRDAGSRVGFWLAISTAVLTVATFGLAVTAIPNSGRNCRTDCAIYPFSGDVVAGQFPGDYLWMFPAMLLMLLFVGLVACIHYYAPNDRKVFSLIGLGVAVVGAAVLLIDYFIQVTVMQPSLEKGQLEGWALFT